MTVKSEIWKNIKSYEGLYQISNLGNVRSLDRVIEGGGSQNKRKLKGRVLKSSLKSGIASQTPSILELNLKKASESLPLELYRFSSSSFPAAQSKPN